MLYIAVISYIISILINIPKLPKHLRLNPLSIITKSTQYFTLLGHILFIFHLLFENIRLIASLTLIIETLVFLLYHGIVIISRNPYLLMYESEHVNINEVTGLYPKPLTIKNLFIYIFIHLNHTIFPIYSWINIIYHKHFIANEDIILVLCMVFSFMTWNEFAWYLHGISGYPLQKIIHDISPSLYRYTKIIILIFSLIIAKIIQFLITCF